VDGETAVEVVADTVSLFASAMNGTVSAAASVAVDGIKSKLGLTTPSASSGWSEGAKNVFSKREWRVPHVDVLISL